MQEKSAIKQKILQYLEKKEVSLYSFYKDSGITRGILNHPGGISEDNIKKFIAYAPAVNPNWLLSDEEEDMEKKPNNQLEDPQVSYKKTPTKPKKDTIPLLPLDAFAGISSNTDYAVDFNTIQENYVIPLFNGKGVDFLISIRGSSMYPKYNSGDVVACKFIKDQLFIQWNKVYVIDTASQGTMVKRLKKAASADFITCKSDNKEYDEFDVPLSDIRNMALVVGVIRLE